MKIIIRYATKDRKYITKHSYQNVSKEVELEPVRVIRYPCGSKGASVHRFYYQADFHAPSDAEFVTNGLIRANIVRKTNPKFDPKKIKFEGNVWNA